MTPKAIHTNYTAGLLLLSKTEKTKLCTTASFCLHGRPSTTQKVLLQPSLTLKNGFLVPHAVECVFGAGRPWPWSQCFWHRGVMSTQ